MLVFLRRCRNVSAHEVSTLGEKGHFLERMISSQREKGSIWKVLYYGTVEHAN